MHERLDELLCLRISDELASRGKHSIDDLKPLEGMPHLAVRIDDKRGEKLLFFHKTTRLWSIKQARILLLLIVFDSIFRTRKDALRITDRDGMASLRGECIEKHLVSFIDHPHLMKSSDHIGSDHDTIRELFGQLDPLWARNTILTDDFIEDNPGVVDEKIGVLSQKSLYHLLIKRGIYAPGDPTVTEDDLRAREFREHELELAEIFRMICDPGRRDITMYHDREVILDRELEDRKERSIVHPWDFSLGEEGKIVVS